LENLTHLNVSLRRRPWRFWIWLRGLGLTEAGMEVSEDTDWNEHRAAAAGRGIMRCLLDMRRFWRRRRDLCLARLQSLISSVIFRDSCIATCAVGHRRWWSILTRLQFQMKRFLLKLLIFLSDFILFVKCKYKCSCFFGQNVLSQTTLSILTVGLWENVSACVVRLETTHVVISGDDSSSN
jgi:hypothetical protein